MNNIIVCWTPFNAIIKPFKGWRPGTPHPVLSEEWIKERFKIWEKFTYPSIAAQSNRRFVYLVSCNILSKNITDSVFSEIVKKDNRVKLFYHGTVSYQNLCRAIRKNYDNVFAIRIDSDDMYSVDTFEYVLKNFPAGANCAYFLHGYGYHHKSRILWKYNCCKSGPFYVVKYSKGKYRFDPIEHPHIKRMGGIVLAPGKFIVNVHGNNYSTCIRKPFFEREINGFEKRIILNEFKLPE